MTQLIGRLLSFSVVSMNLYAEQHHQVVDPIRTEISSAHKTLINKYSLHLSSTSGQKCGAAVVACENSYYVMTARHCLRSGTNVRAPLLNSFQVYFSGGRMGHEVSMKNALEVKEIGDLVKVKLPSGHGLIKQAIQNKLALPCFTGKMGDLGSRQIVALGRPVLGGGSHPFSVSCEGAKCTFNQSSNFPLTTLDRAKSYSQSLVGISGSPVVVQVDGREFFLGAVSQHATVGKVMGPLQYAPMPEVQGGGTWKKSQVQN